MEMLPTVAEKDKDRAIALGQRLNRVLTRDEIRHEAMIRRGLYSASNIATIVGNGATRNSIIGIWHREKQRLGLPSLARSANRSAHPKIPRKPAKAPKRLPGNSGKQPPAHLTKAIEQPPQPEIKIEPLRHRLFELADDGCRHILDEPSDETLYCGLKASRGSFCAGHAQLNYAKGAPRKTNTGAKPGPKPKFSVFSLRAI